MSRAEIATIVETAHERGAKVRAHVADREMILECIELGVDVIDHGDEIDDEIIEKMVEAGTFWVPSLVYLWSLLEVGYAKRFGVSPELYEHVRTMLPRAQQAGVRILVGDDYSGVFRTLLDDDPLDHQVGNYGREFAFYAAIDGLSPARRPHVGHEQRRSAPGRPAGEGRRHRGRRPGRPDRGRRRPARRPLAAGATAGGAEGGHPRRCLRDRPAAAPPGPRRAPERQRWHSVPSCGTVEAVTRNLLNTINIDVPAEVVEETVAFWSAALGATPIQTKMPQYTILEKAARPNRLVIQAIEEGHAGVHFDVHTDDLDAEVERLTALGATVVDDQWKDHPGAWVIMRDPAGIEFCLVYGLNPVRPQAILDDFERRARPVS